LSGGVPSSLATIEAISLSGLFGHIVAKSFQLWMERLFTPPIGCAIAIDGFLRFLDERKKMYSRANVRGAIRHVKFVIHSSFFHSTRFAAKDSQLRVP